MWVSDSKPMRIWLHYSVQQQFTQPGNQGNGQQGYEGQPGNQGGGHHAPGLLDYEGQPGNQDD